MFAELIGKDLLSLAMDDCMATITSTSPTSAQPKGRLNRRALVKLKGCEEQSGSS